MVKRHPQQTGPPDSESPEKFSTKKAPHRCTGAGCYLERRDALQSLLILLYHIPENRQPLFTPCRVQPAGSA